MLASIRIGELRTKQQLQRLSMQCVFCQSTFSCLTNLAGFPAIEKVLHDYHIQSLRVTSPSVPVAYGVDS